MSVNDIDWIFQMSIWKWDYPNFVDIENISHHLF